MAITLSGNGTSTFSNNITSSNGDLTLGDGNLVVADGHGIDFSADGNAAGMTSELLDDYEEGTWTPVVVGNTTTGVGTYTRQMGRYTKIGDIVQVSCRVAWSAHTGTGDMRLQGFPFSAPNDVEQISIICFRLALIVIANSPGWLQAYMLSGNMIFEQVTSAGSVSIMPLPANGDISVTHTYKIA